MVGFLAGVLDATIRAATPLLLASLGELISERGGVLNLGVEGMMLVGALVGFAVTVVTGNPYLGFLAGATAGAAMAAVHAFLTVTLKADQVISGVMLTLLGTGVTTYFGQAWVSKTIDGFDKVLLPVLGPLFVDVPVVGEALFRNTPTDFLAFALVPVVWYFLFRTNVGLELISVGEDPETADTMGVPVFRTRYLAVLLGGAFAGAAGAHLSLAFSKLWVTDMVAGRGWIAIALVIFAQWRPARALVGALLFGGLDALALRSQSLSIAVGPEFPLAETVNAGLGVLTHPIIMSTYPYLVTILVLVAVSTGELRERAGAPSALLKAYSRELD